MSLSIINLSRTRYFIGEMKERKKQITIASGQEHQRNWELKISMEKI